jgi:DNA-binding XRE family transcriptional regulator
MQEGRFMDWSNNIKALREAMLITQAELADKLGVSFASVNRYENGKYEPTMKVKRALMKLFKEYGIVKEEE